MADLKTSSEKLNYLFKKINWGASFLDAQAIDAMNTYSKDIKNEKEQYAKEQVLKELEKLLKPTNSLYNLDRAEQIYERLVKRKAKLEKELQVKP